MKTTLIAAVLVALPFLQDPEPAPSVRARVQAARAWFTAGEFEAARASVEGAIERDERNLEAILLSAEIAEAAIDLDRAVHDRHRWVELHDARPRDDQDRKARKLVADHLLTLDPEAEAWERLQKRYVTGLSSLAKEYERRKDLLGALDAWSHLLEVEPGHAGARKAISEIRRTGGDEVAVEDIFAGGGDPTGGLSTEELAALDAAHADWDKAYTKETDNYKYRTNAGKLVLETSSIAMEQMNGFYRRFFRWMEDGGKTPQIEIRIFKSREEYLALGQNPVEWSAGHFIGSAVETYVGGVAGMDGVRGMYRTLFHEAAHQFVSLTGPFVPGWLNEAYASFFEGCVILSNGSVQWNRVPPGRLFPLATRMDQGWMTSTDEAQPRGGAEWDTPTGAPPFRMVVEGNYQWGPPWYAPTWGVVYFLYNYRDQQGRTVWRDALHEYYTSFKRGQPTDPALHFEEIVLSAKLSPVKSIDELDPIWRDWILALRDRETGRTSGGNQLLKWADAALERGEPALALEFLLEARDDLGSDPDLLWKIAGVLEKLGEDSRAAATYREFKRELELRGLTEDERLAEAEKKILRLDPLIRRYGQLKRELAGDGLALARGYEERELPRMALEIARRMTASFSIPEALAYYIALAERTGRSLARWRLAYDEHSLRGWSGDAFAFQAYGATIRSHVEGDPAARTEVRTNQLVCDVTFDADFSLEAEVRIGVNGAGKYESRLAGLCFGRKGEEDYHAVMLFPDGFLDIASNRGGVWEVHDHRNVPAGGGDWHKLRIDVSGQSLDAYLDGLYLRSLEFPSREVVRGGFGLIAGPGSALFREIRILERDPHDPAARIERELAMKKVMSDVTLRSPGQFSGFEPPELDVSWIQGEATTLAELRGKPVVLAFWTPAQERVIPCARYLVDLALRSGESGAQVLAICDAGTNPAQLRAALDQNPMPGVRVAIDNGRGTTYDRYYVKAGHFGLPRFLMLSRAGRVTFEGDPGFTSGVGWDPNAGPTYVDAAFQRQLDDR